LDGSFGHERELEAASLVAQPEERRLEVRIVLR
jgi:hypothetical protein